MNRPRTTLAFFAVVLMAAPLQLAAKGRHSDDLDQGSGEDNVNVIIQYQNAPGQADQDHATKNGAQWTAHYTTVNTVLANVKRNNVSNLEDNSNVKFITPDRPLKSMMEFARPTVAADIAQSYGWSGAGIGVAIIDSGITVHPDLKDSTCTNSRVVYSQVFPLPATANGNAFGHGTHVAGIVGGNGICAVAASSRKVSFIGIAPKVNLIDLKVLNGDGAGMDSSVIAAIDQAIALKSTYNIRVLNLSVGRPVLETYTLDPLCQAVERAWNAGIVVVVAGGNMGRYPTTHGYGTISSPGNDPYVITVGAMRDMNTPSKSDDQMTSYSSKGPTAIDHFVKPDLVAPGNTVTSDLANTSATLATGIFAANVVAPSYYSANANITPQYLRLSGTSMAAPMVSGAAALLLQKNPSLTPNQVKARLMKTATKHFPASSVWTDPATSLSYTTYSDIFTVGAGYLDVNAALNNTDLIKVTGPLSLPTVYNPATNTISLATGTSIAWGDSIVWGDSLVWGTTVMKGTSLVWGDSIVWGDSLVWGEAALVPDAIMANQSIVWGEVVAKGDN